MTMFQEMGRASEACELRLVSHPLLDLTIDFSFGKESASSLDTPRIPE